MRTSKTPQALMLGVAIGLLFATLPSSCGGTRVVRCNESNCDGCCDETATCQSGQSMEACGKAGASCAPCAGGQMCSKVDQNAALGGQCVSGGNGGGTGTGGGTATGGGSTTGGGTATGGGSATGGGTGSDGGACGPTTCASGCCTASGVCITTTTPSRCGAGGNTCSSCMMGNTCVSGTCTPCDGCIDINTGACVTGMDNAACGKMGGFCQACDQGAGQTCQNGTCFGGTSCNASTCQGCCDGNNCKLPAQYTNAQCGQGAAGAACIGCVGAQVCDSMDAGACVGNPGTGGGTGFPGLDGGGLPGTCDANTPCANGECCQMSIGLCVPNGLSIGVLHYCHPSGGVCNSCDNILGNGCSPAGTCQ